MTIITDLSNADYHARRELSKSSLDLIARSPAHFKAGWQGIGKDTARIGSALHDVVLEGGKKTVDAPGWGKRSNADIARWSAWFEENGASADIPRENNAPAWFGLFEDQSGLMALTPSERALIDGMAKGVMDHVKASEFTCLPGIAEASIITTLEGVPFRVRPDWMVQESQYGPLLVDVKTTLDASRHAFRMSCARYRYQCQAAAYSDAYENETGDFPRFLFIAVEKSKPFAVSVYELDDEAVENGRWLNAQAIDTWKRCVDTGEFPGYGDDFALDIPIYNETPMTLTMDGEEISA